MRSVSENIFSLRKSSINSFVFLQIYWLAVVCYLASVSVRGAPTPHNGPVVVALQAEELPVKEINHVKLNMAKVLDRTLSTITVADFLKTITESVNKNVRPFVDTLGRFNIRQLLLELNRRNQEVLSNIHQTGEGIVGSVGAAIDRIPTPGSIVGSVGAAIDRIPTPGSIVASVNSVIENTKNRLPSLVPVPVPEKIVIVETKPETHYRRKRSTEDEAKEEATDEVTKEEKDETRAAENPEEVRSNAEVDLKMSNDEDNYLTSYFEPEPITNTKQSYPEFVPIETKPSTYVVEEQPANEFTLPELAEVFMRWIRTNFRFRIRD